MYTGRPVYATIRRIGVMPHKWKSLLTGIQGREQTEMSRAKNFWILLLYLLTGIVLGGFIGNLASDIPWLTWLNFGETFGLTEPVVLNFGILVITFGLTIRITMASIVGVIIAVITYRLV